MAYTYPLPIPPVIPPAPDLTPYALKTSIPTVPDLTPYAKKTDIPAAPDLTKYALKSATDTLTSQIHAVEITAQPSLDWLTDEQETSRYFNGNITYTRRFTGVTPNNANDSLMFSIPGATEIVWWRGTATQVSGRKPAMEGLYSGNAAHGAMYTWYTVKANNVVTGMELRQFNQTADTRYQNIPYFVIVEYTK